MTLRAILLLSLSLLLSACGGGADSPGGGDTSAPAEVQAPLARDSFDQLLTADQPSANNVVSLQGRVNDPQGLALRLVSVQPVSSSCPAPMVNSTQLSFQVDNGRADACTYLYTVENVPTDAAKPKQTQATSVVVISATSSPATLPILSETVVVNQTIDIDLATELGGSFPTGFTLQSEVVVLGSGTALADPVNNRIAYTAAGVPGITRLMYSYVSADGTEVQAGAIDVSVSKSTDGMPIAENFAGPEDVLPGAVVTVDVKDHISDPDGDPLQLTDVYAFDATVSATSKTDITNTRFDFVADKPGVYDVTYYVTDHNGGYAIAVVRISVKADSLWSDIVLSDGARYTAPWEKNLADSLGVPYQDYYQETNATGTYDVALFNYNAALTLCAARGMTLPSLAEMNTLHGEKPDPSSSDNWPVERPYWTREPLDTGNNGQTYDLVSGSATLSPILTPAGVTCVYSGILASLETVTDNQYVSGTPAQDAKDEVEALVTSGDGTPVALRNVYFYSNSPGLVFNQKQVATDANGKAKIAVSSSMAGTFTVYANYLTQTLNTAVTFIDNLVSALSISGGDEVRMGQTLALTASASYDSGDVVDVSSEADWTTSDVTTATIGGGVVTGVKPGMVDIGASFAGASAAAHPVTVFAGLGSLEVTPDKATVPVGNTQALNATVYFDDSTTLDVTNTADWSSSNAAVASVDAIGIVTANASGTANIQASYTDHGITQTDSAVITVGKVVDYTVISPASLTINMSGARYIDNWVYYTDGSGENISFSSDWSSSNTAVVTVDSRTGFVTPVGMGTATIYAKKTINGTEYTSTGTVTVTGPSYTSLTMSPASIGLQVGQSAQMKVTANYSDSTTKIVTSSASYVSSNPAVATVDTTGKVTLVGSGTATITAKYVEDGITHSASSTVTKITPVALEFTSNSLTIPLNNYGSVGLNLRYSNGSVRPVGGSTSTTFTNDAPAVADIIEINSNTIRIKGMSLGNTTLRASYNDPVYSEGRTFTDTLPITVN